MVTVMLVSAALLLCVFVAMLLLMRGRTRLIPGSESKTAPSISMEQHAARRASSGNDESRDGTTSPD